MLKSAWITRALTELESTGSQYAEVDEVRRKALAYFDHQGFPDTHHEDWLYTNLKPVISGDFRCATQDGIPEFLREQVQKQTSTFPIRLVFLNGLFQPEFSTRPDSVSLKTWYAAMCNGVRQHVEALVAKRGTNELFNLSMSAEGLVVEMAPNRKTQIELVFLSGSDQDALAVFPRVFLEVGSGSEVQLFERYTTLGNSPLLNSALLVCRLKQNAAIRHVKLQDYSEHGMALTSTHVKLERDSHYTHQGFSFGDRLTRNEVLVSLFEEGASCNLDALYLVAGKEHIDNHTVIEHEVPHCSSNQAYKGILMEQSEGAFSGKVIVHPDAQKSSAHQSNKNLLLSKNATINTRPQLEIFADDVQCSHGATVGQLDDEALFYLRARGIDSDQARKLLVRAFAEEISQRVEHKELRKLVEEQIRRKLEILS